VQTNKEGGGRRDRGIGRENGGWEEEEEEEEEEVEGREGAVVSSKPEKSGSEGLLPPVACGWYRVESCRDLCLCVI
jgi:hypothetical protein